MGIYGGIQLPNINEENLDDKKERKQILNYLALLDEKLRYMFQNIDIEENLSADSQKMFFKYGKDITNLIKDTEGNFSAFQQTIDSISTIVYGEDGQSGLVQTANSITSSVTNLKKEVSLISQEADKISWIVKDGDSASKMELTDDFLDIVAENIEITGYVTFSDLKTEGETKINGANITTGKVSADHIGLYGEMEVYKDYEDNKYVSTGGYFGYMYGNDPLNGTTAGIGMTNSSGSSGVICHGSASAIWYNGYGITIDSSDINFIGDYDFYLATNFYCGTDGKSALGKSTKTWSMLYADACSCCTSDERRKNSIEYDLTAYEGLFDRLKPTQFKMNNGTSDRFHIGFISQDVEKALDEVGLNSLDFAGFIKSPVYKEDKKGREIEGSEIVDYRYGLRYEEFIALNTHMIQKLMARVAELESKLEALS